MYILESISTEKRKRKKNSISIFDIYEWVYRKSNYIQINSWTISPESYHHQHNGYFTLFLFFDGKKKRSKSYIYNHYYGTKRKKMRN